MKWLNKIRTQPWPLAIAAGTLIVIIALAGMVGLAKNLRVKEITDDAFVHAEELENSGSDLEVAILDLRYYHRNLADPGASKSDLTSFETGYRQLHQQIDEIQKLGVEDRNAPQPDQLHQQARTYYEGFRQAVDRRDEDPEAFQRASERGLGALTEMRNAANALDKSGERNAASALKTLKQAEDVERLVLFGAASGLVLALSALAFTAFRMVRMVGELRSLYASQQATAEALEQASRAKTAFLADVSHELRTPLTMLRGNAELGLETDDQRSHPELLREIVAESERMGRMIDDLLFLARSDSESPLKLEPVDADSFLGELARRAEFLARERGATFKAELTGDGQLRLDPSRIEQVVLILVDNAAKYGPKGGRVTLSATTASGELVVSVRDEGPGIPKADLPHIFDRFYRIHKARGRKQGGTGLGLSIAKAIAKAHGGDVEAKSEPGEGTTMTLHVPLLAVREVPDHPVPDQPPLAEDRPARATAPPARTPEDEPHKVDGHRVLVVEDDERISDLLRRALNFEGIGVDIVEDGDSGREAWESGDFDLVLLDVMISGTDGLSLCAERRAAGDETPVILLTARDDEDLRQRAEAVGATDYVGKPFSYADLISRVRTLLPGVEVR